MTTSKDTTKQPAKGNSIKGPGRGSSGPAFSSGKGQGATNNLRTIKPSSTGGK